jgi:non-specific serine/threonine protein kinase
MIGETVSHYRITDELGGGGMGVVYRAIDTKLDRPVALKFLPSELTRDPDAKRRFIHEAKAASALQHHNICTIHEIDESDDGRMFIAMDCYEGETLKQRIARGHLAIEEAVDIAGQVAEGLAKAHAAEVVHRDIKPANIMITRDGVVKIVDFGLAKLSGQTKVTKTGTTVGTVAYMSPEQATGGEVDHRSDIWSLGVILYEMLAGKAPFRGDHEAAVLYGIVHNELEVQTSVPEQLWRIVKMALRKDADKRYQSAVEMASDLKRARGESSLILQESARRRSYKTLTWTTIAVLLLGAVYLVYSRYLSPARSDMGDTRKMVAVLPFENLGASEDEYFADGMTEEITTRLAKLHDLGVISRTSTVVYKDTDKNLRQIADELGVDYVLEGSVRWDKSVPESRVLITAQLIDVDDDTHLWADSFERVFQQIFGMQADIAEQVAKALNLTLVKPEIVALKDRPTENLDAYDLFLKGHERWDQMMGVEDRGMAVDLLEQAVALDTTFASAHALLARIYANDHFNDIATDEPRLEQALAAAKAALRHAPGQPQGHVAMGYYHYYGSRDYENALKEFDEASKTQPNNAEMLEAMGYVLRRQGRWEDAVENLEKSIELDPASQDKLGNLIDTLIRMRRYDDVDELIERGSETAPGNPQLALLRGVRMFMEGDLASSREIVRGVREKRGLEQLREWETQIHLMERDYDGALKSLGDLGGWEGQDTVSYHASKAIIYHCMGETGKARDVYESARSFIRGRIAAGEEDHFLYGDLAEAEAYLGNEQAAREAIRRAEEIMPMSRDALAGTDVIISRAVVKMILGDHDGAIDDLEFLITVPSNLTPAWLHLHPVFDEIRTNSRFQKLVSQNISS